MMKHMMTGHCRRWMIEVSDTLWLPLFIPTTNGNSSPLTHCLDDGSEIFQTELKHTTFSLAHHTQSE